MEQNFIITEEMLETLAQKLEGTMSPKRYRHTAEVEKMAARLGALYAPEYIMQLRAAALLHDITKEFSLQTQLQILQKFGIMIHYSDEISPKTLHARTAALLIPEEYPAFADPTILEAVRWHTTGREGMTVCEKLIYLADYIDLSRTFPDCVAVRNAFWGATPEKMPMAARRRHLRDVILLSLENTLSKLQKGGGTVCLDTLAAREDLQNRTEI